jgi:hypothetical protein
MSDEGSGRQSGPVLDERELELRRYEARIGLWKVVWGTAVVGIVAVAIPAIIQIFTLIISDRQKSDELALNAQTNYQNYIKDFFTTAINQEIELRIRAADYFAHLASEEQRPLWNKYLDDLKEIRATNQAQINDLEARLLELEQAPVENLAEIDKTLRQLDWLYRQVGYTPIRTDAPENPNPPLKETLYRETMSVVDRLAGGNDPIQEASQDYKRFWELYQRDLVGIESRDVARKMVAIGAVLKALVATGSPPSEQLRQLNAELRGIIEAELGIESILGRIGSPFGPEQMAPPASR